MAAQAKKLSNLFVNTVPVLESQLFFIKFSKNIDISLSVTSTKIMDNPKEKNEEKETNSWLDSYLNDSLLSC